MLYETIKRVIKIYSVDTKECFFFLLEYSGGNRSIDILYMKSARTYRFFFFL